MAVVGVHLYSVMPNRMIGHWNAAGVPDRMIGKFWGLFLMPIITAVLLALLEVFPRIDPLRMNVVKFRREYRTTGALIVLFLFAVHIAMLGWNLGWQFSFSRAMGMLFGVFIFGLGTMLPHLERNWFIGIRTPWTIASDSVWRATHRAGARVFEVAGVIAIIGSFFATYALYAFIVSLIVGTIGIVVYSYILFRSESRLKS